MSKRTTKKRSPRRRTARKRTGTKRTPPRTRRPRRRARREAAAAAPAGRAAGFDTGSYPGDAAIRTWAEQSPYAFVGYYFDAPCHTTATFRTGSGKRPIIQAAGLGLAVVYVGFQQDGCGRTRLSRENGLAHGRDTAAKFAAEGFRDGTTVFLDIEHYNGTLSTAMAAYVRGWISAVLDHPNVGPGIYCPASKAAEVRRAAELEFADHGLPGGAPAFWIVKSSTQFDPATSRPEECGVPFARVWQGKLDIAETHGGTTIMIDQNVADSRDPSGAFEQ